MTRLRQVAVAALSVVALTGSRAQAQSAIDQLKRGAKVRIWQRANGYERKDAVVQLRRGDTLTVRVSYRAALSTSIESESVELLLPALDRLEVRIGEGRSFGAAAWRGCKITGSLGAFFGLLGGEVATAIGGAISGCFPGLVIGGLLGSGSHTEWVAVPTSQLRNPSGLIVADAPVVAAAAPVSPTTSSPVSSAMLAPVLAPDAPLRFGARVRMSGKALGYSNQIGTVNQRSGDSLTLALEPAGDLVTLHAGQLDSLELQVKTGKKSRVGSYGLAGMVIVGLFSGVSVATSGESCQGFETCKSDAGAFALIGGLLGYFLGGMLGAIVGPVDVFRWEPIPLARP